MLNSNLVHNLLNVLIAFTGLLTAVLIATGCTQLPAGALECSGSWLDPKWAAIATAGMGVLKTAINVVRDGLGGLFLPQPPVKPPAAPPIKRAPKG